MTPNRHGGLDPGAGWFVLNVDDASWQGIPGHAYTALDRVVRWAHYGLAVDVLEPGVANGMYHAEWYADESFVVLAGDADAYVEGQRVELTAGDLLHCAAGTAHILAGAGDGPTAILMLGRRGVVPPHANDCDYLPDAAAAAVGASVAAPTHDPAVAYAERPRYECVPTPWRWHRGRGRRPPRDTPVGTAPFHRDEAGWTRTGDGWFAISWTALAWQDNGRIARCRADGEAPFAQYGLNLRMLRPGWPSSRYHREFHHDETMLVLDGTCVAIIEGQERVARAGDIIHLPAGTAHTTIGAGSSPCAILMIGSRGAPPWGVEGWGEYVPDDCAAAYGASVSERTTNPGEAYADEPPFAPVPCPWYGGGPATAHG